MEELLAQKNQAYYERNQLVAALSKLLPAHRSLHPLEDTTWEHEWRNIICIHLPTGQVTWHIHDSEMRSFDHLEYRAAHWDGHTTEEKYKRLRHFNELSTFERTIPISEVKHV